MHSKHKQTFVDIAIHKLHWFCSNICQQIFDRAGSPDNDPKPPRLHIVLEDDVRWLKHVGLPARLDNLEACPQPCPQSAINRRRFCTACNVRSTFACSNRIPDNGPMVIMLNCCEASYPNSISTAALSIFAAIGRSSAGRHGSVGHNWYPLDSVTCSQMRTAREKHRGREI